MRTLQFFDPLQKPFGVFSNIAPVKVEVDGEQYPSVQHAVYEITLGNLKSKQMLDSLDDAYDLNCNFNLLMNMKYIEDMARSVRAAYNARLAKQAVEINSQQRYVFYKPDLVSDTKGKYILGVDAYNYGWNVIGKTVEEIYHGSIYHDEDLSIPVYIAYLAATELVKLLHSGNNLYSFGGKLPSEILKQMWGLERTKDLLEEHMNIDAVFRQYKNGTLAHYYYIINEITYPGSLVYLILKKEAPFVNFYIQNNIKQILLQTSLRHFMTTELDVVPSKTSETIRTQVTNISREKLDYYYDKIMHLYSTNRLPIEQSALDTIRFLESQRLTDEQVSLAVNFIPKNSIPTFPTSDVDYILSITDNYDDKLSPVFVFEFMLDGLKFFTILHAIYYQMFAGLVSREEAYNLILKKPGVHNKVEDFKPVLANNYDEIYQQLVNNNMVTSLHKALQNKFCSNPFLTQLLLQTEKDGYTSFLCNDPYDPVLGFVPSLVTLEGNYMNQTGKLMLALRNEISIDIKSEYDFFWELVGTNTFLHAWLKKRLLELRTSLRWFSSMVPIDDKTIKTFFSRFYTTWNTIYRYEETKPTKPPGRFITTFMSELHLSTDVLKVVNDHFVIMFKCLLESSGSVDELIRDIEENQETSKSLPLEDMTTILKKTLSILQHIPRKYSRPTLSAYASLIIGTDIPVPIPETTFFYVSPDDKTPIYNYMRPSLLPIFNTNTRLSHQNIGDLGFITIHIAENVTKERFRFFFQ
jgi:predicted NAD-dependent protein-ADP-ribosyltransferase YbiA (DUF1768 family)